eukprot:6301610-Karenia_brevis.AAC.1
MDQHGGSADLSSALQVLQQLQAQQASIDVVLQDDVPSSPTDADLLEVPLPVGNADSSSAARGAKRPANHFPAHSMLPNAMPA